MNNTNKTRRNIISTIISASLLSNGLITKAYAQNKSKNQYYGDIPFAMEHVEKLAALANEKYNIDKNYFIAQIQKARYLKIVEKLISPYTKSGQQLKRKPRNWQRYKQIMLDPVRINAGIKFWRENHNLIAQVSNQYGVSPQIIIGILGIETMYGQNTGNFKIIDALSTLTFNFPENHPRAAARQAYFQNELIEYIRLCIENKINPHIPKGSYAGAMGMPQFMPSSWINYAVSHKNSGQINLWKNKGDIIASVANYFKAHGWQTDMPTHYNVHIMENANISELLAPDIKPTFTPEKMTNLGALILDGGVAHNGLLALIDLPNNYEQTGIPTQYIAGTQNFYTITRYNNSSDYAMATIELGERISTLI